jgi:hypothetical protein
MGFPGKTLRANLGLKLLALAISFVFWAVYFGQAPATRSYDVPLAFLLPAGVVFEGGVPSTVNVQVRGAERLLRSIAASELSFTVDLRASEVGPASVRLDSSMAHAVAGTEIVRITPAEFRLDLAKATR